MKNQALLGILLFAASTVQAQYDVSRINKKAIESYNRALQQAEEGRYNNAIVYLTEAIQRDPKYVDAYLSIAGVYGQVKDHRQSIANYEKAFALDSNYTSEYRLPYSINLAGLGQFRKALEAVEALLSRNPLNPNTRKAAEYRQKTYQFAVAFEESNAAKDYVFKPINLGDAINTRESEYFPSIPIESDKIIFTRRLGNMNEDFFGSIKKDGAWVPSTPLPGNINTRENEGAQQISLDASVLVFTACHRQDGFGGCDIYMSYLNKNGWSESVNLGRDINTEHWESQPSLSPDKRTLYFASRRPGGLGGSDLYVSHLQANGRWSEPKNMGPGLNTSGDESSPFIHADNQTLYFTSSGLPGYGEEDLFLVRRKSDTEWSVPENLGYPINTIHHEGTLSIAADGKTAYYASDRSDSRGGLDIYSFELREGVRPFRTLWVKGNVFDKKTTKGIPSTVELIDLESRITISRLQTDETGNYLISLPVGKDYAFNVNRKGYLFYSDNYSLKDKSPDSTYRNDIPLQPIELNASVVLKNVFFDVNEYRLKDASVVELERVVQLLQDNPTVKITIEGHTDNVGTTADNLKLSQQRAKAVVDYLTGKGIAATRLAAKGFGAGRPVADNKTETGRAQNRRTELKITAR